MGINVLSLFDGMACGRLALERAGVPVSNYYAAELDKYAMQIAKKNYPGIEHIGDVTGVESWLLPRIDLLIGGSPCQGFSFAGKQLNFEDPRSKLFFEYVRLLKECKPEFFLLENVKMKKEFQAVISEALGVEPIEINSALVSAQNRKRLYWTNIPGIEQPEDREVFLKDILESYAQLPIKVGALRPQPRDYNKKGLPRNAVMEYRSDHKSNAVLTSPEKNLLRVVEGHRRFSPLECERLQTLPDGYTEGVSNTQRYKMIGNGWTAGVVAHIFKNLELLL